MFEDPVPSDFVKSFQGGTCVGPLDTSMSMDEIVSESSLLPAHVWSSALKGLIDYRAADFDIRALDLLRTPTLVLGGRLDEIFDEAAQKRFADALPHAEIWLDPSCGHSPNWEKPQRTAAQIAEFVGRKG
jgi:pimeloyl-ACP methyl ester carboxylesterase